MAAKKNPTPLIIAVIIAIIIIIVVTRKNKAKGDLAPESAAAPSSGIGAAAPTTGLSGTGTGTSISGSTVFAAKAPYPKNQYVSWIQALYNSYTNERKKAGKKPDYPTITVDGVYGPQTANAVYRYMGQYHTSWNAMKTRIDYFRSKL